MRRSYIFSVLVLFAIATNMGVSTAATTRYEAEKASTNLPTEKSWLGYSGASYLCCWISDGQFVTFNVNAVGAGVYTLVFGYSAGNGVASRRLTVNNTVIAAKQTFAATANWSTWSKLTMSFSLNAGVNTVKLDFASAAGSSQYMNLDYLDVISSSGSADGTTSSSPNGPTLITSAGSWTWGGAASGRPGEYYIKLNGVTTAGIGNLMEVANGGKLYYNTVSLGWYLWQEWISVANPNQVTATITLSPASKTISDGVLAGTLLSTAKVTMSDNSTFVGALTTSDTNLFVVSGLNILTKRTFTSADDGTHLTTISIQ